MLTSVKQFKTMLANDAVYQPQPNRDKLLSMHNFDSQLLVTSQLNGTGSVKFPDDEQRILSVVDKEHTLVVFAVDHPIPDFSCTACGETSPERHTHTVNHQQQQPDPETPTCMLCKTCMQEIIQGGNICFCCRAPLGQEHWMLATFPWRILQVRIELIGGDARHGPTKLRMSQERLEAGLTPRNVVLTYCMIVGNRCTESTVHENITLFVRRFHHPSLPCANWFDIPDDEEGGDVQAQNAADAAEDNMDDVEAGLREFDHGMNHFASHWQFDDDEEPIDDGDDYSDYRRDERDMIDRPRKRMRREALTEYTWSFCVKDKRIPGQERLFKIPYRDTRFVLPERNEVTILVSIPADRQCPDSVLTFKTTHVGPPHSNAVTLDDCVQLFERGKCLYGPFLPQQCGHGLYSWCWREIEETPKMLVVTISRRQKEFRDHRSVMFTPEWVLHGMPYRLWALVVHSSNSPELARALGVDEHGAYFSFVRLPLDAHRFGWYHICNEYSTPVSEEFVLSQTAFSALFYQQV
eukprot:m.25787 g.25787  ORF g.25787 m.25787 type:complete len:522 (+) comp4482_c0_seq1:1702-3267(+)